MSDCYFLKLSFECFLSLILLFLQQGRSFLVHHLTRNRFLKLSLYLFHFVSVEMITFNQLLLFRRQLLLQICYLIHEVSLFTLAVVLRCNIKLFHPFESKTFAFLAQDEIFSLEVQPICLFKEVNL